jgi:hypothetical protein
MLLYYYKNDFVRHYPNINGGNNEIQLPRKMLDDFRRRTFSFTETTTINRLVKSTNGLKLIYEGGTLP